MKQILLLFNFIFFLQILYAQFPPPAGQAGSTAIYKDSSIIVAWATQCTVYRGYKNISNPSAGYAEVGDNSSALGIAGSGGVVSLGDGGHAIVQFQSPIFNGPGWDFAIFENSFSDSYLELAFVEVSSDGVNYFRFPSVSNTQTTIQIGAFDTLDATKINNLAGKYRALYGTPFDLEELDNISGLDINNITHIKIIDVVGSINTAYASYDSNNNIINDPWPTEFASSGFDLDAVGVIHQLPLNVEENNYFNSIQIYPNPVFKHQYININLFTEFYDKINVELISSSGKVIVHQEFESNYNSWNNYSISLSEDIKAGVYILKLQQKEQLSTHKIIITE
ncbi:MAG: T9SS type A sorting domain-containing protein [Bacteroidia bacterium]